MSSHMKSKTLQQEAGTNQFAETLSLWARPGFLIRLEGDLGAGKSTFARAFIRALAKDPELEVPSPTFSIVQLYDETRIPVAHIDLYRLKDESEIDELALHELAATHLLLVEWPERLSQEISKDILTLKISGRGDARNCNVEATGAWVPALQRNDEIEEFIAQCGKSKQTRLFFDGDASSRRYETLNDKMSSSVLMDMPYRPDGPPVRYGKPYSQIAHLAEGLPAVVAVNQHLVALGYAAPKILNFDLTTGLADIERLHGEVHGVMMRRGDDMTVPMMTAVDVLAHMAKQQWPRDYNISAGHVHTVPDYDERAQLIEADLLPSWFYEYVHGKKPSQSLNDSFESVWRKILPLTVSKSPQWVMRDYHSPNLIWMPQNQGLKRIGIIDSQDAVMGHPAYDLASMLQDARVDVTFDFQDRLYQHYVEQRRDAGHFDEEEFATAFAILGAQRTTKILGIFARLKARDNKPAYLQHMPRVSRYLARNLQHPVLADLKHWYQTEMPEALTVGKS